MATFVFDAIGTQWRIDTPAALPATVRSAILAEADRFDRDWSRFRDDSRVSALGRTGGTVEFPAEGAALFDLYYWLYALTDGAVDPLVGGALERLGYDRHYALVPAGAPMPPDVRWPDVGRQGSTLNAPCPLVLDVGGAGKGLLVDRLARLLRAAAIDVHVVDGSGDMVQAGPDPLIVGLSHPLAEDMLIGTVPLHERALCASAVTRRAWGDGLHHVLDARTGASTRDVVATWVLDETAMLADGIATAAFFAATDRLAGVAADWVRMFADGRVEASAAFPGEIFS